MATATHLDEIRLPAEVLARLDGFGLSPDSRRQVERDYKLSFRYGGQEVAIRETGTGTEVLKAGSVAEMANWLDALPPDQRLQPKAILFPPRWPRVLRDLGLARPVRRWWLLWLR